MCCMYVPCYVLPHISVYRSFMRFSYAVCVCVLIESILFINAVYVSVVCIVCVVLYFLCMICVYVLSYVNMPCVLCVYSGGI